MDNIIFMEEFTKCLEKLDEMNKTTLLCGDFNIDLFALLSDNQCQYFFNTLASFGYWPTISKTTRFSDNKLSLIDNIFCNNLDFVTKSGIIYDDMSDHFPIFVCCAPQLPPKKVDFHTVFDKSKYEELSSYLMEELQNYTDITDPERACNLLINAYQKGIQKYSITRKHNRRSAALKPWISPAILTSINRRHILFIQKNRYPTEQNCILYNNYRNKLGNQKNRQNCILYNNYRNKLNDLLRTAKKEYIQNQLEINKTNSKML